MMEQNQMETSNSGGTKISTPTLIIVFLLILLGVVVYFGFIEKPKETENPILNNQTEETNKPTTEETNKPITEEKPVVVETKKSRCN